MVDRAPELAADLAREALAHQPNREADWLLWGRAVLAQYRPGAAEDVLWEGHRRLPGNAKLRNKLAEVIAAQGRPGEAEALYRETLRLFPNNAHARTGLATVLRDRGKLDAAANLYRETLEDDSDDDVARNGLAKVLAKQDRPDDAEELYQETRREFPRDPVCRLDLGLLLLDRRRDDGEVDRLVDELRDLGATQAKTLKKALDNVRAGLPHPRYDTTGTPNGSAHTETLSTTAEVVRAIWRRAVERTDCVLLDESALDQLRREADEKLAELERTAPHHPVVRLIARRRRDRDGATAPPKPGQADPAVQHIAWALHQQDASALHHLARERTPAGVTAALASLVTEDLNAHGAAQTLVELYHAGANPDREPAVAHAKDWLARLLSAHAANDAENLLDAVADQQALIEGFGELLDSLLLSLVQLDVHQPLAQADQAVTEPA